MFFLRGIPCGLDFEATQCPNPPSYVPRIFTKHTDRMNFLQRAKNLIFDLPNYFLCDFAFQPYAKLASEFLQRDVTVLDLLRQGSIWLMRLDFVLDYPRPLMPNIVVIGGVNCAHKKLPQVGDALFLILALIDFCVHKGGILCCRYEFSFHFGCVRQILVKEIIFLSLSSSLSIFCVGSYTFSLLKYAQLMPFSLLIFEAILCNIE